MTEIVGLNGKPFAPPDGEPHAGVVALLERLLEEARAGECVGIAIVQRYRDGSTSRAAQGFYSRQTLGELHLIAMELADQIRADDME